MRWPGHSRTALVGLRPGQRREQARQQDAEVDEGETCEQRANAGADDHQCSAGMRAACGSKANLA